MVLAELEPHVYMRLACTAGKLAPLGCTARVRTADGVLAMGTRRGPGPVRAPAASCAQRR